MRTVHTGWLALRYLAGMMLPRGPGSRLEHVHWHSNERRWVGLASIPSPQGGEPALVPSPQGGEVAPEAPEGLAGPQAA